MLDKCFFCKAKVSQKQVTLDYRWGDNLVVIKDVPAYVCQQCGEKYLKSEVYKDLEILVKSKDSQTDKITVDVLTFENSVAA